METSTTLPEQIRKLAADKTRSQMIADAKIPPHIMAAIVGKDIETGAKITTMWRTWLAKELANITDERLTNPNQPQLYVWLFLQDFLNETGLES